MWYTDLPFTALVIVRRISSKIIILKEAKGRKTSCLLGRQLDCFKAHNRKTSLIKFSHGFQPFMSSDKKTLLYVSDLVVVLETDT